MFDQNILVGKGQNEAFILEGGHRAYINFANYNLLKKEDLSHLTQIHFDGISTVLIYNFLTGERVSRHSFDFSSDALEILEFCQKRNKKICFIGGSNSEVETFKRKLNIRRLSLSSWSYYSGYLSELGFTCWSDFLASIKLSEFDLVILGLGAPLQERIGLLISREYSKCNMRCIYQPAISENLPSKCDNRFNLRWLY